MSSLLSWDTWQKAVNVVSADLSELTGEVSRAVEGAVESASSMVSKTNGFAENSGEQANEDGVKDAVRRLMRDESTFTSEISSSEADLFEKWCGELDNLGGLTAPRVRSRMDELLDDPDAYEAYELLVPGVVSMETFFRRYLFRLERLLEKLGSQKDQPRELGGNDDGIRRDEASHAMTNGEKTADLVLVGTVDDEKDDERGQDADGGDGRSDADEEVTLTHEHKDKDGTPINRNLTERTAVAPPEKGDSEEHNKQTTRADEDSQMALPVADNAEEWELWE